jgi:hypothetical protein
VNDPVAIPLVKSPEGMGFLPMASAAALPCLHGVRGKNILLTFLPIGWLENEGGGWCHEYSPAKGPRERLRGSRSEDAGQGIVQRIKRLCHYLRIAYDRHEIRIAAPARDDVPVQMPWEASSRHAPEIQADIIAVWFQSMSEDHDHARQIGHHFLNFVGRELFEFSFVSDWRDQKVSIVVGKPIQDHDTEAGAQYD